MKIQVSSSFFKSLKNIGSLGSKIRSIRSWFYYHTKKEFFHLLKTVFKSYPWDSGFLYELEQAKIQEMRKYHERVQRFEGVEYVIRDMKICESLIDIINEKKDLFEFTGDLTYTKLDDNTYQIGNTPDFKYHCKVYVNTKNIDRFITLDDKSKKYWIDHPHDLYILKAKYLYHKIRYNNDKAWWD